MTTLDYTRQRDIFDPASTNAAATIVGCGGIGSFAAFALAKLGVGNLTLVDFDTVDDINVPSQLYTPSDVGDLKVYALADSIERATGAEVTAEANNLQAGVPRSPVVVSALDSMDARAALWSQVKMRLDVGLFLDGRIGGQHIVLYAVRPVDPTDIRGYEATLHSDEDGLDLPCTARGVVDVGFAIAALIVRAVRRHYAHEPLLPAPTDALGGLAPVTYLNQESLELHTGGWGDE